jgi:hypothetical protein
MNNKLFDNLVKNLQENGYEVSISKEDYEFALVTGKGILGGFCKPNVGASYTYIDGKICFDNVDCFDKWSKCPYSFPIPQNKEQFEYILEKMEYLNTPEGFEESDSYKIKYEWDFPENLK